VFAIVVQSNFVPDGEKNALLIDFPYCHEEIAFILLPVEEPMLRHKYPTITKIQSSTDYCCPTYLTVLIFFSLRFALKVTEPERKSKCRTFPILVLKNILVMEC